MSCTACLRYYYSSTPPLQIHQSNGLGEVNTQIHHQHESGLAMWNGYDPVQNRYVWYRLLRSMVLEREKLKRHGTPPRHQDANISKV